MRERQGEFVTRYLRKCREADGTSIFMRGRAPVPRRCDGDGVYVLEWS
jgi:hypothetical protein